MASEATWPDGGQLVESQRLQVQGSRRGELNTVAGGNRVEVDVVARVVGAVGGEDGQLTAVDEESDRERAVVSRCQWYAVQLSGSDVVDDVMS